MGVANGPILGIIKEVPPVERKKLLTQAEVNNKLNHEIVYLTVTCSDPSKIAGVIITVQIGAYSKQYTYDGNVITLCFLPHYRYTITFSDAPNCVGPATISNVAQEKNVRNITAEYIYSPMVDLSTIDITGGTITRETANCYVISGAGTYSIPLVYGAAIRNGNTNSGAYTRSAWTNTGNTQPFFNYKGKQITSPYIETDTGTQAISASALSIDTAGYAISGFEFVDGSPFRYIKFNVTSVPALGGNAIIGIKDGSGTVMWSWHLWAYPPGLSTIQYTNTNNKTYNFLNVNLGWVKESASSKYGTCPHYQWGRKDPFQRSGSTQTCPSANTATSLAQTIQNPTIFNISSSGNSYKWWLSGSTVVNYYNYWDAGITTTGSTDRTTTKTVYDPCPVGFAVPCGNAFLGYSTGTWESGYTWSNNFFPATGYRSYNTNTITYTTGTNLRGYYATSATNSATVVYLLYFTSTSVTPLRTTYSYPSLGTTIRPVKI